MLYLGRKPAVHTQRTMLSALAMARSLDPLGPAPADCNDYKKAVVDATGGDWDMLGNDKAGCCTWSDTGHQLMQRTANTGQMVKPTAQQVLDAYSSHTGYNQQDPSATDNGDVESEVCQYLKTVGFLGHKSDATGSLDPRNIDHVKWSTQLFGACRLGISLPQSAMDQFDQGVPWDDIGDTRIIGGHDVPVMDFRGTYLYIVTWARLIPVTPQFIVRYADEAHSELFFDWIRAQGVAPNNFSLDQLASDLPLVT